MKKYIQFAWRNIWRNKRRTLITGASIFFGVVFSSIMTSMQEGSYDQMISTIVNSYSGHLQVYKKGYWDDKIINNSLEYSPAIRSSIKSIKNVTIVAPRLESYALASGEELTKGVMVMGIAAHEEDSITGLSKKIISGSYLSDGDSCVVIGSGLAKYMQLNVNDTLILLGQGYHGVSAAGKYRVKGIIKHPSPELDRSIVYMDIRQCQELYYAPDRLTAVVVMVRNNDDVDAVKKELEAALGSNYEIKDWKEINRILLTQIESDRASGFIIKGVLYLIIAFGIFGTIMMMTLERRKEFGMLMAVGMQKYRLGYVLVAESVFIGLLGSIAGIIASVPITWYYFYHPIRFTGQAAESFLQMGFEPVFSFSLAPSVFYHQALTILIFSLLIGLYPLLAVSRLKVNDALRS
jgi:ABC-type lipoprotein release transport system permease subunit